MKKYDQEILQIREEKFEEEIKVFDKMTSGKSKGFRAPSFSLNSSSKWLIDVLEQNRYQYDSSIVPAKTSLYGIPNAPRNIYKPSLKNIVNEDKNGKLIEIPMATYRIPVIGNLPIAGGFYLRFFPYWFMKSGIKKLNSQGKPAMIYIHPKDLDPKMPRIEEYSWYYYFNLKSAVKKFEKLLNDFKFSTAEDVLSI